MISRRIGCSGLCNIFGKFSSPDFRYCTVSELDACKALQPPSRILRKRNLLEPAVAAISVISGGPSKSSAIAGSRIEQLVTVYEESWKKPNAAVDASVVPSVEDFKDAIEEICAARSIKRICVLFDEAAHCLRLDQQRQFFTLFRDLRSPYITCNAAVYPGVTAFGPSFQLAHDALLKRVERDVLHSDYLGNMREIVLRQSDEELKKKIEDNRRNFEVLAYSVNGNPRLLLKTVAKCPSMRSNDVDLVLKNFYRSRIWLQFTAIGDTYVGYRVLVDWARDFIEKFVLPQTKAKNDARSAEKRSESTAFF